MGWNFLLEWEHVRKIKKNPGTSTGLSCLCVCVCVLVFNLFKITPHVLGGGVFATVESSAIIASKVPTSSRSSLAMTLSREAVFLSFFFLSLSTKTVSLQRSLLFFSLRRIYVYIYVCVYLHRHAYTDGLDNRTPLFLLPVPFYVLSVEQYHDNNQSWRPALDMYQHWIYIYIFYNAMRQVVHRYHVFGYELSISNYHYKSTNRFDPNRRIPMKQWNDKRQQRQKILRLTLKIYSAFTSQPKI